MQVNNGVEILLIEDDLAEARLLQEVLKSFNINHFNLVHVKRLQEALQHLAQNSCDVVLLDLTLPDSVGLNSLRAITQRLPAIPVVVLTNNNDDELALEAVREGAQDFLIKRKINVEGLVRSLQYAIERKRVAEQMRRENQNLCDRVEAQNTQLVEAKKDSQLRSEFLSMFSHDFRNPLTTILASAGLLEEKKAYLTEEKQELLLKQIRTAGKSLAQLLDEIVFLGRSDAGMLPYKPQLIDIVAYFQQQIEEFQMTTGNKHQLTFNYQGDFAETLWDLALLQHILDNLIINAIKYSPVGSPIELILEERENKAFLIVKDRGIGVPQADFNKLFIPFNRAKNAEHIPGTGLGLAIVKKCVEAQQGTIQIISQENQGTTVNIILPIIRFS
jgi:signal transduction histidine kinase